MPTKLPRSRVSTQPPRFVEKSLQETTARNVAILERLIKTIEKHCATR